MPRKKASSTSRTPRSASTRKQTEQRKPWAPPSTLEVPEPPDGMHYRWIRAEMMGEMDKLNVGKRFREGFVPVHPDEIDESYQLPTIDDGKHAGVIGMGGLILCKIPIETVLERKEYYQRMTASQTGAIDAELAKESHSSMPMGTPERHSHTTFGNPENKPG